MLEGVLSEDPATALASLRILRDDYLPWLERQAVHRARQSGRDWARIGRLLGRSRQAVRKRFDGLPDLGLARAPSLPSGPYARDDAERRELLVQLRRERDADDAAATGSLVPW